MIAAAHLADELLNDQDNAILLEKENKLLEAQTKDTQNRRDEAELIKEGWKKAISTMETWIREFKF
jgi:hypothetical protein